MEWENTNGNPLSSPSALTKPNRDTLASYQEKEEFLNPKEIKEIIRQETRTVA
jgi:hypothetical protein